MLALHEKKGINRVACIGSFDDDDVEDLAMQDACTGFIASLDFGIKLKH